MSETVSAAEVRVRAAKRRSTWNWHPPLPLQGIPVFAFPPKPLKALRYFFSVGFLGSVQALHLVTASLCWFWLQPALERSAALGADWIGLILVRNLALTVLFTGALHLYFCGYKKQGVRHKFDARDQSRNDGKYFARNQVWDNIFWTCASGVTLWTAYEVLFLWGYANGGLPRLEWSAQPVWFVLIFVAIPFWNSVHFYFVHRLLHWKPLYRIAHSLHHRNINVGPWSGFSMHPIEHVIYFSSVLIHLVVPSHPLHVIFHMHFLTLGAVTAHAGFADLLFKDKAVLKLGAFFHQLHHRYFNCNYGNEYVPCDRWFGSEHDGTPEATARIMGR